MRLALALSTLLAASGGCAHTGPRSKTTNITEAPAIQDRSPDTEGTPQSMAQESLVPETRVIETVARRIREQCGNFPMIGIENGVVATMEPDHDSDDDANYDAIVVYNVPPDKATIECILRASIDSALPKLCIPVQREALGMQDKLTLSIECRDRSFFDEARGK